MYTHTHTHTHKHIYWNIYIYVCICIYINIFHGVTVTLGFMLYVFIRMLECLCVCYRWHRHISVYCTYSGMDQYIYTHTLPLSVVWMGRGKEESVRREEWIRRGWGERIVTIGMVSFSFDSTFLIAKRSFDVNIKCLFCGVFYWVNLIIKIKIIITFLLYIYIYIYIYIYVCVCVCVCECVCECWLFCFTSFRVI